ncbi:cytosine deaminase [Paeniclostridium hominis]|uniref:cytosine deaminase n=1 Tax=Paeniclostridium hominis TaxID=2764329 RepID=UPI0022E2BFC2|nr:cytosine deaminase [Paeniclostridium hominis]
MKAKLFKNARLKENETLVDLFVENGKYKEIGPNLSKKYKDVQTYDLEGNLVVPPYVDPHIHLDYVYTARMDGATNGTGTLFEGIQRWSETKSKMTKDEIKDRAKIALKKEILYGTQYLRTHVDVTDPNLTCLKAIMELKEEVKDLVDIQIIAFPQEGMYSYKDGDKLVEEALKMGADVVGAIPHFEFTREMGEKSVKKTVELAMKYNKLIDIHCDETDDEQSRFLELLAAEAYMNGIGELTTASHACAMGSYNNAYTFKLFKLLALSKINFISCPTENIHLQGRYDTYPKRRGLTRVKELNDAGINVCFAQDSISDPWYPLGNGNLMNILDAGIHICQMMSFEEIKNALDLITVNGAKTLHIQDKYGIAEGKDANFIVLNAKDEFDAILERVGVNCSVRKGEFLFKRAPEVIDTKISLLKF